MRESDVAGEGIAAHAAAFAGVVAFQHNAAHQQPANGDQPDTWFRLRVLQLF